MSSYPLHTIESAPEGSKPVLRQLQQAFGLIPNIAATMAVSPALINGFIGLFERVHASSLTEAQGEEGQKAYGAMTPLQRMADPAEIGAVAAFLASSDSSFMTASEVAVDGGLAQL